MRVFRNAVLAASLPMSAAAQSTSGLEVLTLKTYAYDEMVSWTERDSRPAGIEEVARVDGMVFLDVRAVFDVPWTDDLSRLSVSSGDILVILPDGTEVQSCCSYDYWGMMHIQASGVSVSRPSDYPDEDRDLYWHSIFLVPEGTPQVTLRIPADEGEPGYEGAVPVPAVSSELGAAEFAEFSVSDVEILTELPLEAGRDTRAVTSVISAPAGQRFLDFEITVAPFSANEFDADGRFYWHTYDFRLVGANGETYGLIGERFQDRIMDSQFSSASVGGDSSRRMVFVVPDGVTSATLMFGATAVSEVSF